MKKIISSAAILAACFFFLSCDKGESEESIGNAPLLNFPKDFPDPVYTGGDLPLTAASIELGKRLFFDPILSVDSSISCGSCHAQVHAFADHSKALSTGVQGRIGTRNAPGLANLAWYPSFMHDGGINHLEVLPLAPITAEFEMDEDINVLLDKLRRHETYPAKFLKAFPSKEISSKTLFVALAHFQMSLISDQSKFDRVQRGQEAFSELEARGFEVFTANCASCHQPPLFTDFSFSNNGLSLQYQDAGRALITQNTQDSALFKVPSLRNVQLTYPYMHDGRIYSLSSVVDHYISGVQEHRNLDPRMRELNISTDDKEAILAFIKTLTDYQFISNPKHAEP